MPHLLGGNIGRPLIEEVERLGPQDWAVLELSELQLPTISRGAEIAVYTNIGADHLDRHGTEEAYRAVKARLAELSVRHGHVVLNADDPGCRELGARLPAASIAWYALAADDSWISARLVDGWLTIRGERVLAAAEVPVPGRHTLADALAAALATSLAGDSTEAIAAGIRDFGGVPHRLERVATRNGRGVGQRLAGNDPDGGHRGARRLRPGQGGADRRRQGQGARLRGVCRRDRPPLPRRGADRRDGGPAGGADRRPRAGGPGRGDARCGGGCRRLGGGGRRGGAGARGRLVRHVRRLRGAG